MNKGQKTEANIKGLQHPNSKKAFMKKINKMKALAECQMNFI